MSLLADRVWDSFRCRKCQRVLFKFDDGQKYRMTAIRDMQIMLERAVSEGRLTPEEKQQIEATHKHERVIEVKCPLGSCKTKNYLMEMVR